MVCQLLPVVPGWEEERIEPVEVRIGLMEKFRSDHGHHQEIDTHLVVNLSKNMIVHVNHSMESLILKLELAVVRIGWKGKFLSGHGHYQEIDTHLTMNDLKGRLGTESLTLSPQRLEQREKKKWLTGTQSQSHNHYPKTNHQLLPHYLRVQQYKVYLIYRSSVCHFP